MFVKKLVVLTYLRYVLIASSALLLFKFVPQPGDVSLMFLLAVIPGYALDCWSRSSPNGLDSAFPGPAEPRNLRCTAPSPGLTA